VLPSLKPNAHGNISFLRLMVYILFFPCFLVMDPGLPMNTYYIAGATLLYAAVLFGFPAVNGLLNHVFPFASFIDIIIISFLIYFCDTYTGVISTLYLFPITALSFNAKPFIVVLGSVLSGSVYLSIVILKSFFLRPAIVQVIIFMIFAFYARFLVQQFHHTYFQQANQDTLTKIHNRRFFNHTLTRMINSNLPFSLILIDLDNFKNLNDTQGHHHGDYVLKIVASILKECTRSYDIVARYGGDEFAVVLPHSSKETSMSIAERIRKNVTVNPRLMPYPHISLSLGIAVFPIDAENQEEVLQRADEALYKAKKLGKNKVCVY